MATSASFRLSRTSVLVGIVLLHLALVYLLTQQRTPSDSARAVPPAASSGSPLLRAITLPPGSRIRESGIRSRTVPQDEVGFELRATFAPVYILPGARPHAPVLPERARRLSRTDPASELVSPTILRKIVPEYPTDSISAAEEGAVLLRARIDETGKASGWSIVSSSGSARLDSAALTAANGWTLAAAMHGSHPISSSAEVEFRFRLYPITFSLLDASSSSPSVRIAGVRSPPLGETALRALISGSAPLTPYPKSEKYARQEAIPLRTALATWGNVTEIKFLRFQGSPDWQTYALKAEYRALSPMTMVRWESYEVTHDRLTSAWHVAVDEQGRIWAAKAGIAPWHE